MKQRRSKLNQTKPKQRIDKKNIVYIDLDTKCSCPQTTSNDHAYIQFTRRYLQCQSSMPIRMLRLFIGEVLPHSRMTQVSIFDSNDRLLKDSDRLRSLQHTCSSASSHIVLRFTLINTITSIGHCLCSSPSIEQTSSSSTIIQQETIEQILSACSFSRFTSVSPCLSTSFSSTLSECLMNPVNLLTPPSFVIDSVPDESMIDQITSEFGEICPPLSKLKRYRAPKQFAQKISSDMPLDLSMKKNPLLSLDSFAAGTQWIKT